MAKQKLTIEFDNPEARKHFALWLCGSGEQYYWEWMEAREGDEDGSITATELNYFKEEKFLGDNTIRTTCGRLDNNYV